jgi:hypothetical protein
MPKAYLTDITNQFAAVTQYKDGPVNSSQYSQLYDLEPGLVYPSSAGTFSASLQFTLDNGLTVHIPPYELIRPLRGLDANGQQILDTGYNEVQIYGQPAPEDGPVMGKAFLSQVRRNFNHLLFVNMKELATSAKYEPQLISISYICLWTTSP